LSEAATKHTGEPQGGAPEPAWSAYDLQQALGQFDVTLLLAVNLRDLFAEGGVRQPGGQVGVHLRRLPFPVEEFLELFGKEGLRVPYHMTSRVPGAKSVNNG